MQPIDFYGDAKKVFEKDREREIYNQALDDFKMALEKHQMENWIDNLEYGITFDDVEEVIKQLKK